MTIIESLIINFLYVTLLIRNAFLKLKCDSVTYELGIFRNSTKNHIYTGLFYWKSQISLMVPHLFFLFLSFFLLSFFFPLSSFPLPPHCRLTLPEHRPPPSSSALPARDPVATSQANARPNQLDQGQPWTPHLLLPPPVDGRHSQTFRLETTVTSFALVSLNVGFETCSSRSELSKF